MRSSSLTNAKTLQILKSRQSIQASVLNKSKMPADAPISSDAQRGVIKEEPRVGVGVLVVKGDKILVGKR